VALGSLSCRASSTVAGVLYPPPGQAAWYLFSNSRMIEDSEVYCINATKQGDRQIINTWG
jgi:hypothetical protein